jgi:hypothetical protein
MSGIFRDSFQNVMDLLDDLFQVLEAVVHTCLTCMLHCDVGRSRASWTAVRLTFLSFSVPPMLTSRLR